MGQRTTKKEKMISSKQISRHTEFPRIEKLLLGEFSFRHFLCIEYVFEKFRRHSRQPSALSTRAKLYMSLSLSMANIYLPMRGTWRACEWQLFEKLNRGIEMWRREREEGMCERGRKYVCVRERERERRQSATKSWRGSISFIASPQMLALSLRHFDIFGFHWLNHWIYCRLAHIHDER